MPVYIVTGKLGTGKGKYAVVKMRDALLAGKRVATNFDLCLEHLTSATSRTTATRVPDKPTAQDLLDIGHGNPDARHDEEQNGVLVLDELGSWLNSRSFGGPERAALLDFLIHARKHGWDCYLIVQNLDMIDKQVRLGLAEYLVKCIRLDRVKIPIVGSLLGKRGRLPKMHVANVQLQDCPGVVIDREFYQAKDLHAAYDTLQIFRDWARSPTDPKFATELYGGPFSYLSGWHVKGRHEPAAAPVPGRLSRFFAAPVRPALKPRLPAIELASKLAPDV
ncbi:MAG: hypothetical protein EON54_06675, partial [Alcaligenaceae bacterium]